MSPNIVKVTDFQFSKRKNYMYLGKLNKTAYYHWVWVDYSTAQEFNKDLHNSYIRKIRDKDKRNNGAERRDRIIFPSSNLEVEKILGSKSFEGKKIKYLVKWKGLNYDDCTWEYWNFIESIAPQAFSKHYRLADFRNKLFIRSFANDLIEKLEGPRNPNFEELKEQPAYLSERVLSKDDLENLNVLLRQWHKNK